MSGQVSQTKPRAAATISTETRELERLAGLGRLNSTLIHEISGPITSALLYLEQYKDQPRAAIKKVRGSINALRTYVDAARQQVRRESAEKQFNPHSEIKQLRKVIEPIGRQQNVQLVFKTTNSCKLLGDPVKFQQLLANLILNAVESYSDLKYSELTKVVNVESLRIGQEYVIKISDMGIGIPNAQQRAIFKSFYSTKANRGLGIGLAIVRQYVVDDFHGSIRLVSTRRLGTVFEIRIPCV